MPSLMWLMSFAFGAELAVYSGDLTAAQNTVIRDAERSVDEFRWVPLHDLFPEQAMLQPSGQLQRCDGEPTTLEQVSFVLDRMDGDIAYGDTTSLKSRLEDLHPLMLCVGDSVSAEQFARWFVLRAIYSVTEADYTAATRWFGRALSLNSEIEWSPLWPKLGKPSFDVAKSEPRSLSTLQVVPRPRDTMSIDGVPMADGEPSKLTDGPHLIQFFGEQPGSFLISLEEGDTTLVLSRDLAFSPEDESADIRADLLKWFSMEPQKESGFYYVDEEDAFKCDLALSSCVPVDYSPKRVRRRVGLGLLIGGGTLATYGVIHGAVTYGQMKTASDRIPQARTTAEYQAASDEYDGLKPLAITTQALAVTGLVATTAGALLIGTAQKPKPVMIAPTPWGISLTGRF